MTSLVLISRRVLPLLWLIAAVTQARTIASADDRFAKWEEAIAAFEAQDQTDPPDKGGVLFVGSSSIRLWDLQKSFPTLNALNRGFGGSKVADSLHFADRIILPYEPRIVVVYAGDNDIAHEVTPCEVHAHFQELVDKIHTRLPDTRIVYLAIKPSLKRWSLVHRVRAANALIRATCVEDQRLVFVDTDQPMIGSEGTPRPELFRDDGLHLNEAGYELWTGLLKPHLQ